MMNKGVEFPKAKPRMTSKHNTYELDRLDVKILAALHNSGRMTKLQLAEEVGLSATPCWERIKKLEKNGFIQSYNAVLNLKKVLNISFYCVEVSILNYSSATGAKFEKFILKMDEVVECQAFLGSVDYLLKIIARDVEEYQTIIEKLQNIEDVDVDYRTFPISKTIKEVKDVSISNLYSLMGKN